MKLWKSLSAMLALALAFNGCNWGDSPSPRIVDGGGTEVDGISGTVVDYQRNPVVNARVLVFPDTGAGLAKGLAALAAVRDSARTDTRGYYRIDSLPAGTYALLASTVRNDSVLTVLVRGIVHDGGVRNLGTLVLRTSGSITVNVRSEGDPVAGAQCSIAGLEGFVSASTVLGTCVLQGLPAGSFQVTVAHPTLGSGATGTVVVKPGRNTQGGQVDLDATDPGPIDTTVTPDPTDTSLLAGFAFSEGAGSVAASTGRAGATATLSNGASWTSAGAIGPGLLLNGSTQHASAPNAPLLSGMSELTVEAWVYPVSAPTTLQRIAAVWGPASITDDSWSFSVTAAGRVTLEVTAASNSFDKSAVSTTSVSVGQWNHIVGVYSSAGIRLYLNGALVYTGSSVAGPLKSVNRPLEIGAILASNGSASASWPGRLDELRIYDKARSAAQILASYEAGPDGGTVTPPIDTVGANDSYFGAASSTVAVWNFNGLDASNRARDLSANGLHLTRAGSPTLEASPHGSAAVFSGASSQRFSVEYDNKMTIVPTGRLTLEARLFITEYPSSSNLGGRSFIMGAYAGPAMKLFNDGRFEILYQRNNGSDYWYSAWTMPAAVPLNRWVNVAVAIDNTVTPQQFYAYIDGVPVQMYAADNVASNSNPFRTNYQAPFTVGGSATDSEHFKGKIEEARFSNALVLGAGLPLKDGSEGAPRP